MDFFEVYPASNFLYDVVEFVNIQIKKNFDRTEQLIDWAIKFFDEPLSQ